MTFERAFRFYSYLLLLAGFLTLVSSGAVSLPLAALFLLAAVLSIRAKPLEMSTLIQLLLIALMLGWFAFDVSFLSDPVDALVHLLLLISLVKVFTARTGRDYLLLYLIAFVYVILASAFTISILFLAALGLFVFLAIVAFTLFETREAYEQNRGVPFSQRAYLRISLAITLLTMILAIPIFVVIPRGAMPVLRLGGGGGFLQMTGFSQQVSLGDIGRILQDSRVVMRVRTDRDPSEIPTDVKWRGVALDHFDGKRWTSTRPTERQFQTARYGGFLIPGARRQDARLLRQIVITEPFSNIVFGAPDIIMISHFGDGRAIVRQDGNGAFSFDPVEFRRFSYVVFSDIAPRNRRLRNPIVPPALQASALASYLQLPPARPEVSRLAQQVTRAAPTPFAKAAAIERYLRRNYGYDLDNASASTPDPLYDFLFVRKSGHCEYFATAQAVMMRSVGIPCRLVNGFRQGEFNSWSDHFVVRQSDAHSWVEGFFQDAGWLEFDPTPPDTRSPPFLLVRLGGQWLDALDSFWTEVISFDRFGQMGLFRSAGRQLLQAFHWSRGIRDWLREARHAYRHWVRYAQLSDFVRPAIFAVAALVALGLVFRYRRYLRLLLMRKVLRQSPDRQAPEYYREMLAALRRRGFMRRPSETPLEFARRITGQLNSGIPLRVTELYYGNRFGNLPLANAQLAEVYAGIRELRRWRLPGRRQRA